MSTPVVAVLNLKGGVGKTIVSASIGRGLFDEAQRGVLLVDLDPQFNLTQALQSEDQNERFLHENKTILTAFEPSPSKDLFKIRTSATPPPAASALEKILRSYKADRSKRLAIVMGNFDLVKFSLLSDDIKLSAAKTRFLHFIAQARNDYNVVILDCNPSSSFLTRCALEAATVVLVPVRPDKFSVLGLKLLNRFIERLGMPAPPKLHVLLNATDRYVLTETEQLLRSSEFAENTLQAELFKSDILVARPGFHQFPVDKKVSHSVKLRKNIANVCAELAKRIRL